MKNSERSNVMESQRVSEEEGNRDEGSQLKNDNSQMEELEGLGNIGRQFDTDEQLSQKISEYIRTRHPSQFRSSDQTHDSYCICPDCACQRSVTKPSHTLFNLSMRSVYKRDFNQSNSPKPIDSKSTTRMLEKSFHSIFNAKEINESCSSFKPKNNVTMETIYNIDMVGRKGMNKDVMESALKVVKNDDLLKFNGPMSTITTYRSKFPGVAGGNPYVKPIDKAVRQNFSLNPKTTNQSFFKGEYTPRSSLRKFGDNMKVGLPMLCKQSTSQKFYSKPLNPEKYNTLNGQSRKEYVLNQSIRDSHQFDSIYKRSFNGDMTLELAKQKRRLVRDTMSKLGVTGY